MTVEFTIVTLGEFVNVDEPGATALLGADEGVLIPEGGDVMIYGDGGAGKTTLAIDLACHLAAGDDWLGITVARSVTVLLVENEGPRPHFRKKLARKRAYWRGGPLAGIHVLESPWATMTLADEEHRQALAAAISGLDVDVVIVGPVTRSGMNEAGTLQEVRDFTVLIADLRRRAERPVAFVLIHHENKGGKVSGAWEGAGDTLMHVQAQGHGRTRLYVQKARWSSAHHATSLQLAWADGEGFTVEDKPERDDGTIADEIQAAVLANGGTAWTAVEQKIAGKAERLREIRDRLIAGGRLVNAGTESRTKLWHTDDPSRPTRDDSGTTQSSATRDEGAECESSPVPPLRDGDEDDSLIPGTNGHVDDSEIERLAGIVRTIEATS